MVTKLPKVDVVTVGVGWTGGIIAAELAKQGLKVVGLERGKPRSTDDFLMIHDEYRYAIRYELMQDTSKETITFRNKPNQRALPMRQLGSFLLGEGLGGAGVHWNGQNFRFLPYDFQIKSMTEEKYGANKVGADYTIQDWGITYEEMGPYFDKFEKTIGVSGEPSPLGGQRPDKYPTPPMKETVITKRFKDAAKKLGLNPYHLPSANLSETYKNPDGEQINACQYCGFCERFGCEYGAKTSPNVTVIPTAQKTGNFELRTHANVTRILHDGTKATAVRYVDVLTGEEFEQPAEMIALTSYVMNNTKLLLVSELGTPYDPNSGTGVIGKNYCYQILPGATGFFEKERFNTFMGAGALGATVDDYNGDFFDHSDLNFIHGGSISITQTGLRPIQNNAVPPDTPKWGPEFKDKSIHYYNRVLNIGSQGASMPFRHNFLDLDPTYKDAYGVPLLRLTYNFTEQDKNLYKYVAERSAEIMKEMGADEVVTSQTAENYNIVPYQTTHNTGGVIMGAEPETSAVNNYLQMWDAENVFVVGASAFAHNGGYNPTGTVGALAYRAAEGMLKYSKQGGSLV
ncbi:GMC family oxidoreductase [Bacillus thermotolerans]|uniref:Gluconate 2-dehydrogenase, membrane-bound, flavoprotein n=1 Tax=Bacillus thermotolerans TaxID=1221996 RepID=A0A0F5HTH8_BACTR|nr:GMC family oxidoreductase [Bacillus thermotolerans]KKB33410.1 Gluconate 2-dehydrogenase, membrane-bound, flavoprotein [Bacillus thermotolerans]KKB33955.1 Gluconate 2-dehydrogenase, membrane-bound, flavoprotein [Bacillus thermotolerans]KKB36345.1 Gluconate 2-dehydrogenase, membrane-bound, flavoprotein [Bacillus thermotolerans]